MNEDKSEKRDEEYRKRYAPDGVFGWHLGGLTLLAMCSSIVLSQILEAMDIIGPGFNGDTNMGPVYLLTTLAILIEWGHCRWKQKKRLDIEE